MTAFIDRIKQGRYSGFGWRDRYQFAVHGVEGRHPT